MKSTTKDQLLGMVRPMFILLKVMASIEGSAAYQTCPIWKDLECLKIVRLMQEIMTILKTMEHHTLYLFRTLAKREIPLRQAFLSEDFIPVLVVQYNCKADNVQIIFFKFIPFIYLCWLEICQIDLSISQNCSPAQNWNSI